MTALDLRRQFFAEELEAVCRLRSPQLVNAFAMVPREQFLGPGPWMVLSENPYMAATSFGATGFGLRETPDADPGRVYHNIAVAIDPARQLFNGQPGTLAVWLDTLDLAPGARVLHVGGGLGYYTAVIAQAIGPSGRVVAFEIDEALAAAAARNLAPLPWVDLRCGDSSQVAERDVRRDRGQRRRDASAGRLARRARSRRTHDSADHGGDAGDGIDAGQGSRLPADRRDDTIGARVMTMVAVYSAIGLRDERLSADFGKAMMGGPAAWQAVKQLRRDAHDREASCWLHAATCCLST